MKTNNPKIRLLIGLLITCAGCLSGCQSLTTHSGAVGEAGKNKYNIALPADATKNHLRDPFIQAGVQALKENNFQRASVAFNHALKLDPENAYAHFLNAFTYHLMAHQGDSSKYDLAHVGYEKALQYDRTAWWHDYFLGVLTFEQRNYVLAQRYFAQALLLDKDNLEILKGLITSTYYTGDIGLAHFLLESALSRGRDDAELIRAAAMIYAASGQRDLAKSYLGQYKNLRLPSYRVAHLENRIKEIETSDTTISFHTLPVANKIDAQPPLPAPEQAPTAQRVQSSDKQVIVDVVIIRSSEQVTDRRGINLLDGLSIAFGSSDIKTDTKLGSGSSNGVTAAGIGSGGRIPYEMFSYPRVITRSVSIPTISYSLRKHRISSP